MSFLQQTRAVANGAALLSALACGLPATAVAADRASPAQLQRGRYVSLVGGCNACHTEGFAPSAGKVPQAQWLAGSAMGMKGPWGTTYPANLRLYMQGLSADEWVRVAKTAEMKPPMPWFDLHEVSEPDLRALYAFIRSLGPTGEPAPAYLPPGQEPPGPFILYPAPPGGKP